MNESLSCDLDLGVLPPRLVREVPVKLPIPLPLLPLPIPPPPLVRLEPLPRVDLLHDTLGYLLLVLSEGRVLDETVVLAVALATAPGAEHLATLVSGDCCVGLRTLKGGQRSGKGRMGVKGGEGVLTLNYLCNP